MTGTNPLEKEELMVQSRGHPLIVVLCCIAMVLGATNYQACAVMNQSQNASSPVMLTAADNNGGGSNIVNSDTAAISSTSLSIANDARANKILSVTKRDESVNPYDAERSYVKIGDTAISLNSRALFTESAMMMVYTCTPTAETAFTANAPEESKAIANDRSVMLISSMAITSTFSGREDRLQ